MARGVKKAKAVLTPEEKLTQALVPVVEQPYQVPGELVLDETFSSHYFIQW